MGWTKGIGTGREGEKRKKEKNERTRKRREVREEKQGERERKMTNARATSCQRIPLKRVRSKRVGGTSSTDIERMVVKGVAGQGSCRLGVRRGGRKGYN